MEKVAVTKKRAQVRRLFTKYYYEFKSLINDQSATTAQIKCAWRSLEDRQEKLKTLDDEMETILLRTPNLDEAELAKEFDESDGYSSKFLEASTLYEENLAHTPKVVAEDSVSVSYHSLNSALKKYHLPKLELRKFDGNVKGWLGFWGFFSKIHDDSEIDPRTKFDFLVQATEKESPARILVESYPPTADNYSKAVKDLKRRFARDELLVEVYVRELIQLVIQQLSSKGTTKLLSFYDRLETQVRALETLGVTSDKYATILHPLVESCLPHDLLIIWERKRSEHQYSISRREVDHAQDTPESVDYLQMLLNFLRIEVESEGRLALARDSFKFSSEKPAKVQDYKTECASAASLISAETPKEKRCAFCNSDHDSPDCTKINGWSLEEKKTSLVKVGGCFICLKLRHCAAKCRAEVKCQICGRRHRTIMCSRLEKLKEDQISKQDCEKKSPHRLDSGPTSETLLTSFGDLTYLQTLIVRISAGGKSQLVRALLDSGSQRSYLATSSLEFLDPPILGKQTVTHGLFGGVERSLVPHTIFKIQVENRWGKEKFNKDIAVLDQEKICTYIPRLDINKYLEKLKKNQIKLSDQNHEDLEIKLLLGADVLPDILTNELVSLNDGLVATRTKLGWTVMGQSQNNFPSSTLVSCTNLNYVDISDLWRLDLLGITDSAAVKSRTEIEEETVKYFNESISRKNDGRYIVRLPWVRSRDQLLSNRAAAERRLMTTTKRLISTNIIDDYSAVFKDWEKQGIIEVVRDKEEKRNCFYLPHHAVIKESSETTKIRPVFDASAKDARSNSLNNCLDKGPNLVELIPSLLLKFRIHEIGVTSDIAKAFLQIELDSEERDYLRFLWWEDLSRKNIITYRHCRVVFGVTSSPFLLASTINYHLDRAPESLRATAQLLRSSFYVDNLVISVRNKSELEVLMSDSQQLMREARFDLRGWFHTGMELCKDNPVTPLLGMEWNYSQDSLLCEVTSLINSTIPMTKRGLLSAAQRLFDPIGFTSPVSLRPKLWLQETWKTKTGWDTPLSQDIAARFKKWLRDIHVVNQCRIPRRITTHFDPATVSIHVFSDASGLAYAGCVFLRTENLSEVIVRLVQAKSRVTPLKEITMPRLELLAALIASRLCKHTREILGLTCKEYLWSDSTVALTWITRMENWSVFVTNRVDEIRINTDPTNWHHIPGKFNAADLLSRGCSPKAFVESQWWEGPNWLRRPENEWPQSEVQAPTEMVDQERRRTVVSAIACASDHVLDQLNCFPRFSRIVRTVSWIRRFYLSFRKFNKDKIDDDTAVFFNIQIQTYAGTKTLKVKELSGREINNGEYLLFKMVQIKHFVETEMKRLSNKMKIIIDSDGVRRVKTRLTYGDYPEDFKNPILLPSNDPIVHKFVFHCHERHQHAGTLTMVVLIRERYWILRGRKTVQAVVSKCVTCKKNRGLAATTPEAPLPKNRITCTSVFQTSGVDLAGPLFLKGGDKGWIVLFTCATFRAVHLELVQSLSTDCFLQALRRFIARRGRISTLYSDNATNFVGAFNALKLLDWQKIVQETSLDQITWIFIPPASPWWGGWWERLVGLTKQLLRRNLGRARLSYEQLTTVLCDIEAVINSRPLTYVSEQNDDLVPLTPAVFLHDIPTSEMADLDFVDRTSLNRRVRRIHTIRENLRSRFRKEYLALLIHKGDQKTKGVIKNDIVLVEMDNRKRINWPIARVIETFPGKDANVRVARLKLSHGELIRPVQKLYPLEVSPVEERILQTTFKEPTTVEENIVKPNEEKEATEPESIGSSESSPVKALVTTRSGRQVKRPKRFD